GLAAAVPLEETATTLPATQAAPTSDVFVQSAAPQATTAGLAGAVPIESGALAVEEAQIKKAQYEAENPQPQPTTVDKAKELASKVPQSQLVTNAQEFVTHTIPTAANAAYTGISQKVNNTVQTATQSLSHMIGLDKADDSSPTPDVSGAPGGFPNTPAFERRESEQMGFKVTPLPASKGPDNPITLAPGEEVPKWQAESVDYAVK